MKFKEKDDPSLTQVRINQKFTCAAVVFKSSYWIVSLKDLRGLTEHTFDTNIVFCEMYENSNLLFIVLEENPCRVCVWDDSKKKEVEHLLFTSPIRRLIVRLNFLTVWTEEGTLIVTELINFRVKTKMKLKMPAETIIDSPVKYESLIGWNYDSKGDLYLWDFVKNSTREVELHKKPIKFWVFDRNGHFVASLNKGSIVKVYDIQKNKTHEYWLNYSDVDIFGLAFNFTSELLAVVERSGVLKVFLVSSGETERGKAMFGLMREKPIIIAQESFVDFDCFWTSANELVLFSLKNSAFRVAIDPERKSAYFAKGPERLVKLKDSYN